jgi:alpha-L-fucosidase
VAADGKICLPIFQWPDHGPLLVPGLRTPPKRARLIGGGDVHAEMMGQNVALHLPQPRPASLIPTVVLELDVHPETERLDCILAGCRNVLETAVAARTGCELRAVRWMEKFGDWKHAECLADWQPGTGSASWDFRTLEPVSFHLDIEYTCPEEGDYSEWAVEVAGTEMIFPLIDTGERAKRAVFGGHLPRFRTYRVGLIDLPGPGQYRLTLRPLASAPVRVASLILEPAT